MRILKFGGSSVANYERIENVINIVQQGQEERDICGVVVSAFSGVTDTLTSISQKASKGDNKVLSAANSHWRPDLCQPAHFPACERIALQE